MSEKKRKKSTLKIDGEKLKNLLESTAGKNIYKISVDNGFSRNLISEACRSGYASAVVQNVAKLYGIAPDAYKIIDEPQVSAQISIDDLETAPQLSREEIKEGIVDAMAQIMPELTEILTKAMTEAFKKACFEAFEENVPYLVAEFGKSSKGNTKAAIKEALMSFGWKIQNGGNKTNAKVS